MFLIKMRARVLLSQTEVRRWKRDRQALSLRERFHTRCSNLHWRFEATCGSN